MIDNYFRSHIPKYVKPLVRAFSALGITPNMITVAAFLIAAIAAVFVYQKMFFLGLLVWWAGRLLDAMDGILARHLNRSSEFGAYLDITLDMFAYSLMVIAFMEVFPEQSMIWKWILLLYVLCITSALAFGNMEQKLGAFSDQSRKLRLGAGLAEAGETGIAYSVFLLFPSSVFYSSRLWLGILIITVISRTLMAYKLHRKSMR